MSSMSLRDCLMAIFLLFLSAGELVQAKKSSSSKRSGGNVFGADGVPTMSPTPKIYTYAPSPTELWASESPTGAQTITHDPDWTEAQLISVIVGSVVGLTAVILAIYCAYARGACEEGPKISGGKVLAEGSSAEEVNPIFTATDRP